ncbi:hypothetical protein EDC96DRAFT_519641 [Choanephora cucurbitarum]|nr:hypothetical protein EDC96DRAFT_519641 [Choanephora cucurbitarum]
MTARSPQTIISSSVNPANLLELKVLSNIVSQLQEQGDMGQAIPYLAKMVQIVDSQRLEKPTDPQNKTPYYSQLNELQKLKADAYSQLAFAYLKTHQFVQCESWLTSSIKLWEKLIRYDPQGQPSLMVAYEALIECYMAMGKDHLAQHIQTRLCKLKET